MAEKLLIIWFPNGIWKKQDDERCSWHMKVENIWKFMSTEACFCHIYRNSDFHSSQKRRKQHHRKKTRRTEARLSSLHCLFLFFATNSAFLSLFTVVNTAIIFGSSFFTPFLPLFPLLAALDVHVDDREGKSVLFLVCFPLKWISFARWMCNEWAIKFVEDGWKIQKKKNVTIWKQATVWILLLSSSLSSSYQVLKFKSKYFDCVSFLVNAAAAPKLCCDHKDERTNERRRNRTQIESITIKVSNKDSNLSV